MSTQAPEQSRSPLRGKALALAGIVLVALSLRTAIASVSPIVAEINVDVPLSSLDLGVIGMLPPACFAAFGLLVPATARRLGLELTMLLAVGLMVAGSLARALGSNFSWFLVGSILAFGGAGVGGTLLPPLVKRYFPGRIGPLTSLYAATMSVSAFLPPLIAVPVADSPAGWRASLGIWAATAAVAAVPWLVLVLKHRRERIAGASAHFVPPVARGIGRFWRSRTAWAITIVFSSSSMTLYAVFAWLPPLLRSTAHVSPLAAGALLALYAAAGFPAALLIPMIVARAHNVSIPALFGAICMALGILGLLLAPALLPWLWVILLALGRLLFPLAITLISSRTRTHETAVNLSGFVNGVGYTIALFGPLLFGALHQLTGTWSASLVMLLVPALAAAVGAAALGRPKMVDDE